MRHEVTISFDGHDWIDLPVNRHELPTAESARHWLDQEFVRQDCDALRSSGKVLTADKVLALAAAVGAHGFAADPQWSQDFAHAAVAALDKPVLRVDVSTLTLR
jgi:hypothetical protein